MRQLKSVKAMPHITIHIPAANIVELDLLVGQRLYFSRSEAIRVAIQDLLRREVWLKKKGE